MKCMYCAEIIQDEAILCRFCGAKKQGHTWVAPTSKPRASRLFQNAGFFFFISAGFEFLSWNTPVRNVGQTFNGIWANAYHGFYALLFIGMAVGTRYQKKWAPRFIYIATAVYVLDKIIYLLTGTHKIEVSAMTADWEIVLTTYGGSMVPEQIIGSVVLIMITIMMCWVGFAGWVYYKRDLFHNP